MDITSKTILEHNLQFQAKQRKEEPKIEPCFECKHIAIKLGYKI